MHSKIDDILTALETIIIRFLPVTVVLIFAISAITIVYKGYTLKRLEYNPSSITWNISIVNDNVDTSRNYVAYYQEPQVIDGTLIFFDENGEKVIISNNCGIIKIKENNHDKK